jgi:hypothetical protein
VRLLFANWVADAPERRRLEAIEARESPAPRPAAPRAWWR